MSVEIARWLNDLPGVEQRLDAGQYLFHRGDPVVRVFVVQEGHIRLVRYLEDGAALVLQTADSDSMLAEASLFLPRYHCDAVAIAPTRLKAIEKTRTIAGLRTEIDVLVSFAAHLAKEVQQTRMRSEILRLKTVAQRFDAWLEWHDGELPEKGKWALIALEIGISPEALYREMARRRRRVQPTSGLAPKGA
jgi:CRP/FNR family transcriptional regulator, dissimilatory nitrate respiration regulator